MSPLLPVAMVMAFAADAPALDVPRNRICVYPLYGLVCTAVSADGKKVITSHDDNSVRHWDVATGAELLTLRIHTHQPQALAFSPDGKLCASGSFDKVIKVWDAATGKVRHTFTGHD